MRDNSSIYLSVIIPAYNEEKRLPSTLDLMVDYFKKQDYTCEIIVVSDGSKDHTAQIVKDSPHYPDLLKLIDCPVNQGKGQSVKEGVLAAVGKFIIYNDADGAAPIEEIEKLWSAIHDGFDIAIGSRAIERSAVKDLWYRHVIGVTFNTLIKIIILGDFLDTQCGFKLFKRECARTIFENNVSKGFSFDVEILFLAKKLGYKVAEIPIAWHSVPGSKINLLIDSPLMLLDIIKIRLRDLAGKYRL
jgi:dolichyl-phosphate beta-glucosyltransferase